MGGPWSEEGWGNRGHSHTCCSALTACVGGEGWNITALQSYERTNVLSTAFSDIVQRILTETPRHMLEPWVQVLEGVGDRWLAAALAVVLTPSFTSTVIRQHHSSSRLAANGAPTSFSQALGSRDWLVEKASELNPSLWLLCSPVTFVPSPIRNTGHTQAAGERREAREAGGGTGLARCRGV